MTYPKPILFFFLNILLLLVLPVYSQSDASLQRITDSLNSVVAQKETPEEKAAVLLELSYIWGERDTVPAVAYVEKARSVLGAEAQSDYYQGVLYYYTAAAFYAKNNEKAKSLYLQANKHLINVKGARLKKAYHYRSRALAGYAGLLQHQGQDHQYVQYLFDSIIPLSKKAEDTVLLGNNYRSVAMNLMNQLAYDKAEVYYKMALDLLQGREDAYEQRFDLYTEAARNYIFADKWPEAKEMIDQATAMVRKVPYSTNVPYYHAVAGSYYAEMKDLNNAKYHFEKGLEVAEKLGDKNLIATLNFDQYNAYSNSGQKEQAMEALLKVVPYVESTPSLTNRQMVYFNLAKLSEDLNNYPDAMGWYKQYMDVSDSIYKRDSRGRVLELEKQFEVAERQNELLEVKAKNQEQSIALQKTRTIAISSVLLLVILLSIGIGWYKTQKNKKALAQQKQQALRQELITHKQQLKLNVYNAMLEGEERERLRLSRDLHDGLGGMLASVKMRLSAFAQDVEFGSGEKMSVNALKSTMGQLDQSVSELRRIARNLMPDSLVNRGLEDALGDLCKGMSQDRIAVDFQSSVLSKSYSEAFMISIYRVVQELLTNAIKHSEATQVWVQCSEDSNMLYISVEDNGKGFCVEQIKKKGMGLNNIRNRIELLNGQLVVDSGVDKGSSFHINIPKTQEYDFSYHH